MIAYIEGKILNKLDRSVIVETNSVGYEIYVPAPELEKSLIGEKTAFYTRTYIREDEITIYGFKTSEELMFFKRLITVPGVGPKTAMDLMATPLGKLKGAILHEDLVALTRIPGIGKKTAERIILELKGKIELLTDTGEYKSAKEQKIDDAVIEAIARLGYQRHHINNVLKEMPENIKSAEEIIKYFLQNV